MRIVLIALCAGAALLAAPGASSAALVCDLLQPEEIAAVQGVAVKERKASEQSVKGLQFAQCFYATDDFVRSISVTLITGDTPATKASASRQYWEETFNPQRNFGRKNAPRAVTGFGEAAYWTGDGRAGVLYILINDAVVRVSLGGVASEEERLQRTRLLAQSILRRLGLD